MTNLLTFPPLKAENNNQNNRDKYMLIVTFITYFLCNI